VGALGTATMPRETAGTSRTVLPPESAVSH